MQTRLSRTDSRRMRPDLEAAIEYLPGLASLALWCNFADTDENVIAFTDGQTIYAGAEYENFSEKERRFVCLHEILHIALCHPSRFLALEKQDVGFEPQLLNIAADAIINKALENLTGLKAPQKAWTLENIWWCLEKCEDTANSANVAQNGKISSPYSFNILSQMRKIANLTKAEFTLAGRWSCEELYYFLKSQAQKLNGVIDVLIAVYQQDSISGDLLRLCGASALPSSAEKVTDDKRNWQQRMSLVRGTMPELFQRLAGELPKTETTWEQILRSLVQTVFQETTQMNYSRPSRRWLALERDYKSNAGVNLQFAPDVTKKRGNQLVVALDTSGSIDTDLLGRFLSEIAVLCSLNQRNHILIIGDAKVHQIAEVDWRDAAEELTNLKYTGGGGTDFRPLIKAAAEYNPDALIYLTDLYGETGEEPEFPVIWATHGVCGNASWGEQIKLK
jgi:predicted metal-dependent peptidase